MVRNIRIKSACVIAIFFILMIGFILFWYLAIPKVHSQFLEDFTTDINQTSRGFNNSVTSLAYNKNSEYLVVGRESGDIEIWDTTKKSSKQIISNAYKYRVNQLQFSTNGYYLLSNSTENEVKHWDLQTRLLLHSLPNFYGPVLQFSKKDMYLAGGLRHIYFLDAKNNTLDSKGFDTSGGIESLAINKKKNLVAVGYASSIDLFEVVMVDKNPSLKKIGNIKPYKAAEWVIALYFSSDSKRLYSVSRYGQINEWSIPDFEKVRTLDTRTQFVYNAKFLHEGKFLALVGTSNKNGVPGNDFVEVITMSSNASIERKMPVNIAQIEYISPLNQLMAISGNSVIMIDIPKNN